MDKNTSIAHAVGILANAQPSKPTSATPKPSKKGSKKGSKTSTTATPGLHPSDPAGVRNKSTSKPNSKQLPAPKSTTIPKPNPPNPPPRPNPNPSSQTIRVTRSMSRSSRTSSSPAHSPTKASPKEKHTLPTASASSTDTRTSYDLPTSSHSTSNSRALNTCSPNPLPNTTTVPNSDLISPLISTLRSTLVMASPMDDAILDREDPMPTTRDSRPATFRHQGAGTPSTRLVDTPTIAYSQILSTDSELEISQDPTMDPAPSIASQAKELRAKILQNGKTLKQSLLDMATADHHRVVLRQAVRSRQIPRGLQPNTEPHIYKADPLVLSEWDQAQKELSIRLANILIKHYSKVIEFEQTLQNNMQAEMQREISRANLSTQDSHYIERMWKEETDAAVSEAKKFSNQKAAQRRLSEENSRKRARSEDSDRDPYEQLPKNLTGAVQRQLEEFKTQMLALMPPPRTSTQIRRGRGGQYRGPQRGRGRGKQPGRNSGGRTTPNY